MKGFWGSQVISCLTWRILSPRFSTSCCTVKCNDTGAITVQDKFLTNVQKNGKVHNQEICLIQWVKMLLIPFQQLHRSTAIALGVDN